MDHVMSQGSSGDLVSIWLRTSLPDVHDDILKAPLPDELVELVALLSRHR
ncbi:MAG: hypothetical protein ACRYG6_11675 [Janthinobacterium lividum]